MRSSQDRLSALRFRIHDVSLCMLDRRHVRDDSERSLQSPKERRGVGFALPRIEDAQPELEHETPRNQLGRPRPRDDPCKRFSRVRVQELCVERP